jgi:RNA polymerase sigma factor (sigma-70 family)
MDDDALAREFETHRPHLRAVAHRMLGSLTEADDAVQEAWLRLHRSDTAAVDNLGGWLTTVVSRVCLDVLRSRTTRREEPLGDRADQPAADSPEGEALLADSVGPALMVVLDTLAPAERLAFVLHDLFAVPFDEIATIVGRSPAAVRQLASRARRRVRGVEDSPDPGRHRREEIVRAFLAAAREGNFDRLLKLLDPDVVLRADTVAVAMGASPRLDGARAVAERFNGARAVRPALVDGVPGAIWAQGGTPRVVFAFSFTDDGRVVAIEQLADPERLDQLELEFLEGGAGRRSG